MNEIKYTFRTPGGAIVFFSLFENSENSIYINLNNANVNLSIEQLKNIKSAINTFVELHETENINNPESNIIYPEIKP